MSSTSSLSLPFFFGEPAVRHRHQNVDVLEAHRIDVEGVVVEHDEGRLPPDLEGADLVVHAELPHRMPQRLGKMRLCVLPTPEGSMIHTPPACSTTEQVARS